LKSLAYYHRATDGGEIELDLEQESEGTLHLINLLPAIILLTQGAAGRVLVIDELGLNLHTNLMRELLEKYLLSCSTGSRSQLLLTTHDVCLMDHELLSREEIWVAQRNGRGESELIAMSDFKSLRPDKDIRDGYLMGFLGGIPQMMDEGLGISRAG